MRCPTCAGFLYLDSDGLRCICCARPLVPIVPLPLVKTVNLMPKGKEDAWSTGQPA